MAPASVLDRLHQRACEAPDSEAFAFLDDELQVVATLTCAELVSRAAAIRSLLHDSGVRRGDRVLLVHPPSLDFVTALFGAMAAGALPVPVFPPNPLVPGHELETLAHIAANCEATAALTTQAYEQMRGLAAPPAWPALPWIATDHATHDARDGWAQPDAQEPAFLQYTSGSTGRPRGVVITHANLAHQLEMFREKLGFGADARMLFWVPPYHDLGLISGIFAAAYGLGHATMMSPLVFLKNPSAWPAAMSKYGATHTAAPNFAFDLVVRKTSEPQRAGWDLRGLRVVLSGGEPVRPATARGFVEAFGPCGLRPDAFCPAYGLAEHSVGVTVAGRATLAVDPESLCVGQSVRTGPAGSTSLDLAACGAAAPDVDLRIVDPRTSSPLPPDTVGEIWVNSPSKAAGYWGDEDLSQQLFHAQVDGGDAEGFLRTGDLGFLHDGELFVCGRLKDMIIIGGHNVFPHDIEDTVRAVHPAIRPGGVVAFASRDHDAPDASVTVLCEVVGDRDDLTTIASAVRDAVAKRHGVACDHVGLGRVGLVPKTTSGKLRRQATRSMWLAGDLQPFVLHVSDRPPAVAPPPDVSTGAPGTDLLTLLRRTMTSVTGVPSEQIGSTTPLREMGASSLQLVEFTERLSQALGREVPATLPFEAPTLLDLARALQSPRDGTAAPAGSRGEDEPLAIVGVGLRMPGEVADLASLRALLYAQVDAVDEVPAERWAIDDWYDADPQAPGKMVTRWGGFIRGIETFEPGFFGIASREAPSIDPQCRMLLETCWEAVEFAGIRQDELTDSNTGVYLGLTGNDYQPRLFRDPAAIDAYALMGTAHSAIAARLSYWLGLRGPNMPVDTACSSSLVALHLACQAIHRGDCDLAFAGGANVVLAPEGTVHLSRMRALSPTGRCRAFADDADGYVRAEGAGVVLIERLSDARRRGHPILAVIRGSAINQDGHRNGFTAPNPKGQEAVIRAALGRAGVAADEISYVECHGTGTPLGDPIEVAALREVFGARPPDDPLFIGSVKSNIGHLEAAAGIAGVIKTIVALREDHIPPSLHAEVPSRRIPWDELPIRVVREQTRWPDRAQPRRASVSSFGLSGTNAHVVLEQAPPELARLTAPSSRAALVPLSAMTDAALSAAAGRLAGALDDAVLADVALSAGTTRTALPRRLAVVAASVDELRESLLEASRDDLPGHASRGVARRRPPVAFLFTGQGSQYAGMGRELATDWPVFDAALRKVTGLCDAHLDRSLLDLMWAEPGSVDARLLDQTRYTQPALFALQWALCELWRTWGVSPDFVCGHSIGEVAAACVAGSLTLEDAAAFVCDRGELMQELPPGGGMLAASLTESEAVEALGGSDSISLASINGPRAVVFSGKQEGLDDLADALVARGATIHRLTVSHAFHSPPLDPILAELGDRLSDLEAAPPQVRFVSSLRGHEVTAELTTRSYWVEHARMPVRFADAVRALDGAGARVFIELGPTPVLSGLVRGALTGPPPTCLPSMRPNTSETRAMLDAAGAWFCAGGELDWSSLSPAGARRIPLPLTAWQRELHWVDARGFVTTTAASTGEAASAADATVDLRAAAPQDRHGLVLDYLARTIRRVTRSTSAGIDGSTPLIELGMDSLMGLELRTAVKTQLGVDLPLSLTWQGLSVGELGRLIVDAAASGVPEPPPHRLVLPLRPSESGTPFFCIHPIHGTTHVFQPLASALGDELAVFGVRAPGLEPGEGCVESMDRLVDLELHAIEQHAPPGPLHLLGYSFGAAVAHAIACRIPERVRTLTLVDGLPTGPLGPGDEDLAPRLLLARAFELPAEPTLSLEEITQAAVEKRLYSPDEAHAQIRRMHDVIVGHLRCWAGHRPARFPGVVHVVRTEQTREVDLGWQPFAQSVATTTIAAAHESILNSPAMETLRDAIVSFSQESTR